MTRGNELVALDLAIPVPETLRRHCAALNAALRPPPDGFHFDDTHQAHVSLVQHFVRATDVDDVSEQVTAVLRNSGPLLLHTTHIKPGRTTSVLGLELTPELERLHGLLMDRLAVFESDEGDSNAFVTGNEPPRSDDVRWVQRFRTEAAYGRFDPHITLGVGFVSEWTGPTRAVASDVALCHLGRFCTCRHILSRWTLTP